MEELEEKEALLAAEMKEIQEKKGRLAAEKVRSSGMTAGTEQMLARRPRKTRAEAEAHYEQHMVAQHGDNWKLRARCGRTVEIPDWYPQMEMDELMPIGPNVRPVMLEDLVKLEFEGGTHTEPKQD